MLSLRMAAIPREAAIVTRAVFLGTHQRRMLIDALAHGASICYSAGRNLAFDGILYCLVRNALPNRDER